MDGSSPGEVGSSALSAVSQKGKLGNDQNASPGVQKGKAHFALVVFKNAQVNNFVTEPLQILSGVALFHSQEAVEAGAYPAYQLAVHLYFGTFYPLNYGYHGLQIYKALPDAGNGLFVGLPLRFKVFYKS